jgi:hypothetical protein
LIGRFHAELHEYGVKPVVHWTPFCSDVLPPQPATDEIVVVAGVAVGAGAEEVTGFGAAAPGAGDDGDVAPGLGDVGFEEFVAAADVGVAAGLGCFVSGVSAETDCCVGSTLPDPPPQPASVAARIAATKSVRCAFSGLLRTAAQNERRRMRKTRRT